jgi:benzoate membrane transport protein
VLHHLERPAPAAGRRALADLAPGSVANGVIGFIFAATGPLAVILAAGRGGGLTPAELASWVFGSFCLNGLLTLAMSWRYRLPLVFFFTIPGTVLVGQALDHLSLPEVIGAYYATALLMLLLGLSGWVRRAMALIPMPIVMGMVAGVFLRFGLDLVRGLHEDLGVAAPMVVAFLLLSAVPTLGRRVPPMLGTLAVGVAAVALLGRVDGAALGGLALVSPVVQAPVFSVAALVELVVPLAITVLVVQNGQGIAVLQANGHTPPVNTIAAACGIGALACAVVGAVSTCLTGPVNAILSSSGARERQYTGALVVGALAVVFGLLAPTVTNLMLAAPRAFIMTLAGLAMLRVLQSAFTVAFRDRCALGALVSFLVTVADLPVLNIGAAFWGLVAGALVSWLLERDEVRLARPPREGQHGAQ